MIQKEGKAGDMKKFTKKDLHKAGTLITLMLCYLVTNLKNFFLFICLDDSNITMLLLLVMKSATKHKKAGTLPPIIPFCILGTYNRGTGPYFLVLSKLI